MIKRGTWVLVAVFGVLLAIYLISQARTETPASELTPTVGLTYLLNLAEDQVEALEIRGPEGASISIQRAVDGGWSISDAVADQVDQGTITSAIRQLTTLRLLSELDGVEDIEIYGLDTPQYTLSVREAEGSAVEIKVGDETPTGSGYYVQVNGQPPKVVNLVSLDFVLELLRDPPILPVPEDNEPVEPTATAEAE